MSLLTTIITSLGVTTTGGEDTTVAKTFDHIIEDNGNYASFPFFTTLPNGKLIGTVKDGPSHVAAGVMNLYISEDGGATYTKRPIKRDGVQVSAYNLGLDAIGSRILFRYIDSTTPGTQVKIVYSDDEGLTWNNSTTYSIGRTMYPFDRIIKMPSGKVYWPWYTEGDGTTTSICALMQSTDNGITWTAGPTVAEHTGSGTDYYAVEQYTSEMSIIISHMGATDATTKLIALLRPELSPTFGGELFMFYHSSDGGVTWAEGSRSEADRTYSAEYPAGVLPFLLYEFSGSEGPFPPALILYNDEIYLFVGWRKTGSYQISYIKGTPDDWFVNLQTNYTARTIVVPSTDSLANTLGGYQDWGYPQPFIDYFGQLCIAYYDVSSHATNSGVTIAERCIMKVVVPT